MGDNRRYIKDSTISESDVSVTSERDRDDDDGTQFFRCIHVICMNYLRFLLFRMTQFSINWSTSPLVATGSAGNVSKITADDRIIM
jgi:hypothetical protein